MNEIPRIVHRRAATLGLLAASAVAAVSTTEAALSVPRLTPPSTLFSSGNPNPPINSRFLQDQRFDLQATISPDAGQSIVGAQFSVDGTPVPGAVTLVPATVAGLPAGTAVASLRAYANSIGGVHLLSITATQSDNLTITAVGNFEVLPITPTTWGAKNVIILIGDGMGQTHRTAARIVQCGIALGKAKTPLAMDRLPHTGNVMTCSENSIVTDSSPGASCYATGNKANNNEHGVVHDDTTDNGDNPRIESIGEYLHRKQGRSLGLVTTTDIFDSTPAAFGSHTQSRTAGTGICDEYFDLRNLTGLTVLMGGGRKWFLPNTTPGSGRTAALDYVRPASVASAWGIPAGAIDAGRNLLDEFIAAGFTYAPDRTALNAIPAGTTNLLGLFGLSNLPVAKDKIDARRAKLAGGGPTNVVDDFGFPDVPMLDEITAKALEVLSQNSNGFVVMIEGGSIDKQAHLMDADRMILDTIEFDRSVEVCRQFALTHPDTLVVVTADHECGGASIIGASRVTHSNLVARAALGGGTNQLRNGVVGTLEQAGFPNYTNAPDGYPVTTDPDFKMLIGWGVGADRYEDWITNPRPIQHASHGIITTPPLPGYPQWPLDRDAAGNYFVVGQISDPIATHSASDIPLSAMGRNAFTFGGSMDNTDVFFKVMQVALGDAHLRQEFLDKYGDPGTVGISGLDGAGAHLSLKGSPGGEYVLKASADLHTWTNLLVTANLPQQFIDTDAKDFLHRFYRLVWQ